MDIISEKNYIFEKKVFTDLLIDTRMHEITYSETFNLVFYKYIQTMNGENYEWAVRKMNLIIDAPFWVGDKSIWEQKMKDGCDVIAMNDQMLVYELVNIRYNNLIQVSKVDFWEKHVCITLEEQKVLVIAYFSDSDYSWILEEYNDKNNPNRMMVFCQGNEIFAKNIPDIIY